ncbi:hypothetical protein C7S20_04540 [Christiangramia fulva]|uniref:Uncharacterized protein n=1 Tax=Christiangramia fulva TaxID=2126553 RepID=A0A2R3Z2T5_9FLAO|nr:hypothetical protein [Christiangramia fulva]AVR44590.1 hypothetical protein C7S20_04540 [Christiangramia fulva]
MELKIRFLILIVFFGFYQQIFSQAEFETWGNLKGIRTEDGFLEFETSLLLLNQWNDSWETRKEGQKTSFHREGNEKIFEYEMKNFHWRESIISKEKSVNINVSLQSTKDTLVNGAYFRIKLPQSFLKDGKLTIEPLSTMRLDSLSEKGFKNLMYKNIVNEVALQSGIGKITIRPSSPVEFSITREKEQAILNFAIANGEMSKDSTYQKDFEMEVSGGSGNSPVTLKLYPSQPGKKFDGIGGNFRLQNPKVDPDVIDYALENLPVSWARVELPWRQWDPDTLKNPLTDAKKGTLDPKVKAAMELAQRLDKKGIPVILATWFPPQWAVKGALTKGVNLDGSRGNQLDPSQKEKIYESITSYIKYLKEEYGVKVKMFSFNESDLGIDVRQTPEEQEQLIAELGEYFKKAGLETKLLLGDTADANGYDFTELASINPESLPYIGGVSFHSWRGYSRENLIKWFDISNRVKEPLFVGEGSIDAGAWRYPEIFQEPGYALEEIRVYLKILKYAQPLSILQWQLTSDYSILSGGGVFGNNDEDLHPTQRFFNLKQLGTTPKGLQILPINTKDRLVTATALGDGHSNYAIHMVNEGNRRSFVIKGIPEQVKKFNVYTTNSDDSFKKGKTLIVKNGELKFEAEKASFISLLTKKL